ATAPSVLFPALDPATANNLSNYSLKNLDTGLNENGFITGATFVATASDFVTPAFRTSPADPFSGRVDLTFNPDLPAGRYVLTATPGLRDSAGNALNNTSVTGTTAFSLTVVVQHHVVATGADAGGGPLVRVFNAATGGPVASFLAYDLGFRGGVRV